MWLLYFLLAVPLCEAAAVSKELFLERDGAEHTPPGSGIQNIEETMEQIASEFLQDLMDAQNPREYRRKREMRDIKPSSLLDKTGTFRLQGIKPFLNVCSRPTDITFVVAGTNSYAICISTPADDTPTTANLLKVTTRGIELLDSWYTNNPSKAVSFTYGQELYVLVADSGRDVGTDLIKFDVSTYKHHVDHRVNSKHATAIALWEMKMDGSYHLAIANSNGNKNSYDLTTEIFTYKWMGTYFDQYSSIPAYDVKDMEPFHIHNMAYLAVANHRRGVGNYHVDSEILKYNLDKSKWMSLQKIRTYGAMDWEFFTLGKETGKEFFLAIANYVDQGNHEINSVIYKFVTDKFVPFQCLLTRGATSIASFSDELFLLAIANEHEAVYLYQYNGWRFVPASVQYTQSTMSSGVASVSFHKIVDNEGQKLVLAVSNPKREGPALYEIELVLDNALDNWYNNSTEWCMGVLDEIENSELQETLIDMNNVIYTDKEKNIVIEGNFNFADGLEASAITAPKVIDVKNRITYDDSILLKLRNLNSRLQAIEERLKKAELLLLKAVNINGSQILSGNYSFKDVTFNCESHSCHFESLETLFLNNEDVVNLKSNIILTDEEVFVAQPLSIETAEVQNLTINGLVDGVDVSNVVTKSGSHYITGTKTFLNPIRSKAIDVAGLIDGETVTPYTVLLDGGFQNVTGKLTFTELETSSLEVTSLVNDVDLNRFYKNMVLSDKYYIIEGKKEFNDIIVKDINVKSINRVDISGLWNNVMWKHEEQLITAPMSFTYVTAANDVFVKGYINGLELPGPKLVLVNSSGVIDGDKVFKNTTKISKLVISSSLNGIGVLTDLGENQLDVLLKEGSQVITGQKTFREILLDDDSYLSGTVNEIDLSELKESAWRKNVSITSTDSYIFTNLVVKGPLTVHGLVDDTNLNAIYEKALKLQDSSMPPFESLAFKDSLLVEDLKAGNVNGLDLTKELVLTEDNESVKSRSIKGIKTFNDVRLEADSSAIGLVNKINISILQESILRLGNQVIAKPLTAEGNLKIRNLTVTGLLNDMSPADLLTLSGHETITVDKVFSKIEAENLHVENLEVKGLINDMDIEAEMENTMTYDGQQTVSGVKSVTGKTIISKDSNLNTDSLNDVDLSSVWEDSVRVDVPQSISGNKVFSEDTSLTNLWFRENIDGVQEWDLKYNWMLQDVEQEVLSDVVLAKGANVLNLMFSGYINNVSVKELDKIVKRTEPAVITGPVVFEGSVISYGDITLTGSVQNVDLSEDAAIKHKHIIFTGEKEFLTEPSVIGDLTVSGLIDNVHIKDICENSVLLNQSFKLNDVTVMGNVTFEGGVKIGGLLAGIDVDTLYGLKTDTEETFINGLKTFRNLTIKGPVKLNGKVGGVDIKFLNDSYMSLSRDQEISSSMNFDRVKVHGTVSASNFYTHDDKVNEIEIGKLRSSLLRTSGKQSINATYRFDEVIFADDVIVVGRVNSIEIPKGLMRQNRTNYVYNFKVFQQHLTVLGDLVMEDGKTVHKIDVSEWEKQSVLKDGGKYFVDGWKAFNKITLNDIRIHGTLSGIKISEDDLFMTYGDQNVEGKKEIAGNIAVLQNMTINGLLNGININDLARRAARRHKNNTFSGVKYFNQPVTIVTLETGLINGVDLEKLHKTVHTKLNFDVLSNRITELKEAVSEMQAAFDNQAVLLQYYEYFQGFRIPGSYLWHYAAAPDTKELLLLSDISLLRNECTSIKIFEFNTEKQLFEPKEQSLLASYAVAMETIFIWDSTYLFVANRMPSSACSSMDNEYSLSSGNGTAFGEILVWNKENETFSLHQAITMGPATDVVVFSDHNILCAVYTELVDTKLYCAEETENYFSWKETLQTKRGRKMSVIEDQSDWPVIRLAVAGTEDNMNYVDFYNWKGEAGVFGTPIQRIKASNVNSVKFILHPNTYSIFLAISDDSISRVGNVPRLLIYKLEEKENKLIKYQEIKDSGYLDWMILPNGDLVFFVLRMDGDLNIYRHRYSSRFVREDTLYRTGAKTLHAFNRMIPEDTNHYLALAGPHSILPHEPEGTDFSKILKSNIKGKRLLH